MTAMDMAGKPGRSGRKSNAADKKTLAALRKAVADTPPKKFVEDGKKTVRAARKRSGS